MVNSAMVSLTYSSAAIRGLSYLFSRSSQAGRTAARRDFLPRRFDALSPRPLIYSEGFD